ncbi:hypothetical protein [Lacrimispora amygdalina]|nr:hypothetical protein [Lacrimispora amygdalina]
MTGSILLSRITNTINDYGDVFITEETENSIKIKDGEGNIFEIQIDNY